MKERPILFSGPMVSAILDGRKTTTRRIVKPQPVSVECGPGGEWWDSGNGNTLGSCPYGTVGDRLWVRETWCEYGSRQAIYRADYGQHTPISDGIGGPWKPSIHMPRWASRLTLEITGVRVERLQDIGRDGRKAEHVKTEGLVPINWQQDQKWFHPDDCPAIAFGRLWDSINGKTYPWSSSPWVWVVSFNRVEVC